jgi:CBS domain-containing protein
MATAREIMTPNPVSISGSDSVREAARKMAELSVGSLPICGEGGTLTGMITDRDIVVKILANDKDPRSVHASELAQGEAVTIGADDSAEEILATMTNHQVRRLPVIDGQTLIGIVAQADVARAISDPQVGDMVEALSVDY